MCAWRQKVWETAPASQGERDVADLAASFQTALVDAIADRTRRAADDLLPRTLCADLDAAGFGSLRRRRRQHRVAHNA